ncbi:MAG: MFS transporter, partial [Anaerolineae bacterium]|nr:MFS transporter [Anaerolineae bacterium]
MYSSATSKRLLYTLFATQSLLSAANIAIFTLMAIVATRLGGTESVAGLPSSTMTFTQALVALPVALLMGRFGRRLGLTLGYSAAAVGGLVGLTAIAQESFPLLLLSAVLLGMSRASGDQSRFAAGELFPAAERARMIGRVIFAGTIGAIVGPVLVAPSGHLMESLGWNADMGPWAIAFGLCTVAALVTLFLLRPDPLAVARAITDEETRARADQPAPPARSLRTLLMLPSVQLAMLSMLIGQTVMVVLMVMTPLHMDHHQHGRDAISLVISAHTLGMFGLSA